MGFAGQIFAARVAVGLALPSPSAFSEAGQMVGGFAAKIDIFILDSFLFYLRFY